MSRLKLLATVDAVDPACLVLGAKVVKMVPSTAPIVTAPAVDSSCWLMATKGDMQHADAPKPKVRKRIDPTRTMQGLFQFFAGEFNNLQIDNDPCRADFCMHMCREYNLQPTDHCIRDLHQVYETAKMFKQDPRQLYAKLMKERTTFARQAATRPQKNRIDNWLDW